MKKPGRRQEAPVERLLSPLALPEGTTVGRWRVVRPLGQGGFGCVYAVREAHAPQGPVYALKLARRPEDPGFGREAEGLRRVRHPGVVRLVEAGRWQVGAAGHPYLVLEYVRGESLYRWAQVRNPTARQVAALLLQAAEALAAAHAQGVLHRDFKGDNVRVDADGRLKVLDWGAGIYPEAAPLTCTANMPPGTWLYYSPQVMAWRTRALRGGGGRYPYTEADEAYAVGVTFYRLLSDEYPPRPLEWGVADADEAAAVVPEPLARLNPRVPGPLAALIMRLLAFEPGKRLARLVALADEVRRLLQEADATWEAPLFEWYEGPGTHSRTTSDEGLWEPMAPGHEAALMRDRMQLLDVQANKAVERSLRRRAQPAPHAQDEEAALEPADVEGPVGAPPPVVRGLAPWPLQDAALPQGAHNGGLERAAALEPQSAEVEAAPGEARQAEEEALASSPGRRVSRARALLAGLGAMGLVGGWVGAWVVEGPRAPIPARAPEVTGREVATPAERHHSGAVGSAPAEDRRPPPSLQEQLMPPFSPPSGGVPGLASTLKRGAVVCGAAATVACSGSQVRPPDDVPCPDGALAAMQKLGLLQGETIDIYLREDKRGGTGDPLFVSDGEITSRVGAHHRNLGEALVRGYLWTKGEKVIGRYTSLELPDGRRYPVCLTLCEPWGCNRLRDSTPDAPALGQALYVTVVDRF
jgi:serine/threonine-protein kinase